MVSLRSLQHAGVALAGTLLLAACTVTFPLPTLPGTPTAGGTPGPVVATPITIPTLPAAPTQVAQPQQPAPAQPTLQPTPLPQIVLMPTDIVAVEALENVNIRSGPGTAYSVVGRLAQGMGSNVLMVTADGGWWQITCPTGVPADCFVTADPDLTRAVTNVPPDPRPMDPGSINDTGGIVIESLDVRILESFPVQVQAVIEGYIPDGCIRPYGVPQVREGNTIRLSIQTTRTGQQCTQAIIPYSEVVGLDVSGLPAGAYNVAINDLWASFDLPGGNETPAGPEVIETDVEWVLIRADIPAMQWPGPGDAVVGALRTGEIAQVTGMTPDGAWWEIVCVQSDTPCYVNAAFATPTGPQGQDLFPVVPTDVGLVMAQVDTPILEGPYAEALPAGLLFAGQMARVTGVTADQTWWRVDCDVTQTTARECYVSADPSQTTPAGLP